MSSRLQPIPASLLPGAFTIHQGAAMGLTDRRLRHHSLARPTSGVRSAIAVDSLAARARAFALVIPGVWAFSHTTAARLLGLPLLTPWSASEPLHVMRPGNGPPIERRGVVSHRGLERRELTQVAGVAVVAAQDTWCDVCGLVAVPESVVMGDAVINAWTGIPVAVLAEAVERRRGHRHVRSMREALTLVRTGSRSPMESVTRLVVSGAGLPEPELNVDIFDEHGQWIARPDLWWPVERVAAEYDGAHHGADPVQWRRDVGRRRVMTAAGIRLHVLTAADLANLHRAQAWVETLAADLGVPAGQVSWVPGLRRPGVSGAAARLWALP